MRFREYQIGCWNSICIRIFECNRSWRSSDHVTVLPTGTTLSMLLWSRFPSLVELLWHFLIERLDESNLEMGKIMFEIISNSILTWKNDQKSDLIYIHHKWRTKFEKLLAFVWSSNERWMSHVVNYDYV